MKLTLNRHTFTNHSTIGELLIDGVKNCVTLEPIVPDVPPIARTSPPPESYYLGERAVKKSTKREPKGAAPIEIKPAGDLGISENSTREEIIEFRMGVISEIAALKFTLQDCLLSEKPEIKKRLLGIPTAYQLTVHIMTLSPRERFLTFSLSCNPYPPQETKTNERQSEKDLRCLFVAECRPAIHSAIAPGGRA